MKVFNYEYGASSWPKFIISSAATFLTYALESVGAIVIGFFLLKLIALVRPLPL